jgi:hypothetical protein
MKGFSSSLYLRLETGKLIRIDVILQVFCVKL